MNHRIGRILFALCVGLGVAVLAFRWVTDPLPRAQREAEERAVHAARELVIAEVGAGPLEIVDPLAPDRKVGKVYVYAEEPGWAISGFYRRDADDRWHAYLIQLTSDLALDSFKAEDPLLQIKR